jgi:hypothetical protein
MPNGNKCSGKNSAFSGIIDKEVRVSTKLFMKSRWVASTNDVALALCVHLRFYSPSRKSFSRDSKETAHASDFAEPLTLSAL